MGEVYCATPVNQGPQHNRVPPLLQHGAGGSSAAMQDVNETCDVQVHALEHRCSTSPKNSMSCLEDRELPALVNNTFLPALEAGTSAVGL